VGMIFVWRLPKGHCYGNQLNMGDVRKRRVEQPLKPFALAFDNGLVDCKSAFKRFNGNNKATSYPNLENRARQLYKNISMLFLFPVNDGKLSTGVNATFDAACYG